MMRSALMRTSLIAALGIVAVPNEASAHLVSTGLGPLYDGALHFVMSPEAILPVVALGIFAGLHGIAHARVAVLILPIAWAISGVVGTLLGPLGMAPAYESIPLIILGGLAAANPAAPAWVSACLALLLGLAKGYVFGSESSTVHDGVLSALGTASVVFVLIALVVAGVIQAKWDWSRIAARVVGSWTAAAGVLLLGWGLR